MNLFNDNVMARFQEILICKQMQVSLDRFLVKVVEKEYDSIEPEGVSDSSKHKLSDTEKVFSHN